MASQTNSASGSLRTVQLRVAFLADIHGNLPALGAVLADARRQGVDAYYLVGDQINRCPWNNEVLDLAEAEAWPAIRGNHELIIGRINTPENRPPFTNRQRFPTLWWTAEQLTAHHRAAIRCLPDDLVVRTEDAPPVHLLHGLPGNPFEGIYPTSKDADLLPLLAPVVEPVIVCAHTHRPLERRVGRWQIYNPGSVGMPYNGDPRAHYVILDLVRGPQGMGWMPNFRRVEYDREIVVRAYQESGMAAAIGGMAELNLRTIQSGLPWASDFGRWMRDQPSVVKANLDRAIDLYLESHGPDNWAFRHP